jgi:hypothetical protein
MKMLAIVLVAMSVLARGAIAKPLPDVQDLLKRVEERLDKVTADTNHFHYTRTNLVEEIDSNGKVKKTVAKTYLVLLSQGLPRARVVAIDGKALSEAEQKKHRFHEERFQRAIAQEKTPDYEKPKPWLDDELMDRFQFNITGRTNRDGRTLVMVTFSARTNAPAQNMIDRVINKISGALWVDEEEAEIALLELRVNEPVKFWGGILGQLEKFDFTMQRRRSDLGVWFNYITDGVIHFRKLFSTTRFHIFERAIDFAAGD